MFEEKERILFLCGSNSARSQLAEALLRRYAGDRFDVCSAGLHPTVVHPLTYRVLNEIGIDSDGLRAKSLKEFLAKVRVHCAIIVCEMPDQDCPTIYPFALTTLYWPFDDPIEVQGSEESKIEIFREVRDQIDAKIRAWLSEQGISIAGATE